MPQELVKIVCQAVAVQRDGDRIVGEVTAAPVACYSPEELVLLFERAQGEIAAANAAELAAAKPARAQRRAAAKKKKPPPAP